VESLEVSTIERRLGRSGVWAYLWVAC
jgi:hypothetical protein